MKIKKKTILLAIPVIIVGVVIALGFWANNVLIKTWEDPATWTIKETISLPKDTEKLKIKEEIIGDVVRVTVDYCTLYRIEVKETQNTYHCSLQPFYNWAVMLYDTNITAPTDEIVITVEKSQKPDSFLGRTDYTSEESLESFGSTPVPVSLSFEYSKLPPQGSISKYISHYKVARNNEVDIIPAVINSWEIVNIPSFSTLTEEEKNIFKDSFMESSMNEVNTIIEKENWENSSDIDLIKYLKSYLYESYYTCKRTDYISSCNRANLENFSEFLFYYIYSDTSEKGGQLFKNLMIKNMSPFVSSESATDLFNSICTDELDENCDPLTDIVVYTTPICPILGSMNVPKENIDLFMKYNSILDKTTIDFNSTMALLNEYGEVPEIAISYDPDGYDQNLVTLGEFYSDVDLACYKLIKEGVNTNDYQSFVNTVDPWLYYNFEYVNEKLELQKISSDKALEFAYYSVKLQPYESYLISRNGMTRVLFYNGITTKEYEENVYMFYDLTKTLFIRQLLYVQ